MDNNTNNLPIEKFQFATRNALSHDSKFETKPVSYFQGAFSRFCKNNGAVVGGVVIAVLVLFAILAPFFTPFQPAYYDMVYAYVYPKLNVFAESNIDFWDGCKQKDTNYVGYLKDLAIASETGREVIKHGEYTVNAEGNYVYRYDTYYGVGFGKYKIISKEEFNDIQRYQNETGRQVLYPVVKISDRPTLEKNKYDANIYYKVENPSAATLRPKLDNNGNIIPNYWKYEVGETSGLIPEYKSLRIEGEAGSEEKGKNSHYAYGRKVDGGIEIRAEYYEYYTYQHTQVQKDGIGEPLFLFGTTQTGKDIFACLAYGARFSFLFATAVALVNFIVGVIWGSISGYSGGKIDLCMERFAEILGSVPTMIVITLLKYHMGTSSQVLVLFIAFFATGWIGMAGRTRMQFYRFKNQEYVMAARTLGARDSRVIWKHIFPNSLGTIITSSALVIPGVINSESMLSFLGIVKLGTAESTSLGTLLADASGIWTNYPHLMIYPAVVISLLMICFNLFGNGLRDAFNPALRGVEE